MTARPEKTGGGSGRVKGDGCVSRVLLRVEETGFENMLSVDTRVMSEAERERCGRYLREEDRASCVSSRVLCRVALGSIIGKSPESLVFGKGIHGKPFLQDENGTPSAPWFNISHSHGLIILAASLDTGVGVDVEKITPKADTAMIARRFFSPDEALSLSSLSGQKRLSRFYALWTLKEAAMKAMGGGIFMGLSGVRFSFGRDGSITPAFGDGFPQEAEKLHFVLFEPRPGFMAAAAAFGDFSLHAATLDECGAETPEEPVIIAATGGFHRDW